LPAFFPTPWFCDCAFLPRTVNIAQPGVSHRDKGFFFQSVPPLRRRSVFFPPSFPWQRREKDWSVPLTEVGRSFFPRVPSMAFPPIRYLFFVWLPWGIFCQGFFFFYGGVFFFRRDRYSPLVDGTSTFSMPMIVPCELRFVFGIFLAFFLQRSSSLFSRFQPFPCVVPLACLQSRTCFLRRPPSFLGSPPVRIFFFCSLFFPLFEDCFPPPLGRSGLEALPSRLSGCVGTGFFFIRVSFFYLRCSFSLAKRTPLFPPSPDSLAVLASKRRDVFLEGPS